MPKEYPKRMQEQNISKKWKLIVAISGASGAIYARNFLRSLYTYVNGSTSLIISNAALRVLKEEISCMSPQYVLKKDLNSQDYLNFCLEGLPKKLSTHSFILEDVFDIGAASASGSNFADAMIVIPCSMKTISGISHSYSNTLIERAADVSLKEKRKLILVPRETPLHAIHLENMLNLAKLGAYILPASPGFYYNPKHLEDIASFISGKIFNVLGIPHELFKPWNPSPKKI